MGAASSLLLFLGSEQEEYGGLIGFASLLHASVAFFRQMRRLGALWMFFGSYFRVVVVVVVVREEIDSRVRRWIGRNPSSLSRLTDRRVLLVPACRSAGCSNMPVAYSDRGLFRQLHSRRQVSRKTRLLQQRWAVQSLLRVGCEQQASPPITGCRCWVVASRGWCDVGGGTNGVERIRGERRGFAGS